MKTKSGNPRAQLSRHQIFVAAAVALTAILSACGRTSKIPDPGLADPNATAETRALFVNLQRLSQTNLLFGHQDDLAYGVSWIAEEGRSDVRDASGSYPSVFGWELGDLETGSPHNLDDVNFADMQRWIKYGYSRGSVITISWHMDNPVSEGSAWDTTRAIQAILPGGEQHERFKSWLDDFAAFANDLEVGRFQWLGGGNLVPLVFRPYHEHTGSWFWWGGRNVTADEYKRLWRFTVEYLRDEKGVHNLLYVFSTDVFNTEEEYLRYYPGDDYVDLLGYDDYHSLSADTTVADMTRRLDLLVSMAESRGKLAALTESGLEGVPDADWWTNRLLAAVRGSEASSRIAYALVWRNANTSVRQGHFYAPYAGQSSAADFQKFRDDPFVLFADELPPLYRAD